MKWQKSPREVVQAFEHSLPIIDGVQRRPMYGYPCAYFNGHLFCGLHGEGIIVLLSDAGRERLVAEGASVFEPTPGQPMKEYVVVPPQVVADRQRLRALLSDALAHVSSLAPKGAAAPATVKEGAAAVARKVTPGAKSAPSKVTAPKMSSAKKAGAKKASVKKAPVKKSAAKRTAAKKPAAKKTVSKKVAVRKAPPSQASRGKKKADKKKVAKKAAGAGKTKRRAR